jgi:hypothetical protein
MYSVFHYWSDAEQPYRPHLPHPEFYRVAGVGDVEIVGLLNDPDRHVLGIDLVTNQEAVQRFRNQGRDDLASLHSLAIELQRKEKV